MASAVAPPGAMGSDQPGQMPANLDREQLQAMHQKYTQLCQQGYNNSPEALKLRNVLEQAKKHLAMQRQRQMYMQRQAALQQQQHQHQHQSMQNGTTQQNGVRPPSAPSANGASGDQEPNGNADAAGSPGTKFELTEAQKVMLSNQMTAFKLLTRDAPLDPSLQRKIFISHQQQPPPTPEQALDAASQIVNQQSSQKRSSGADQYSTPTAPVHTYESYKSPYDSLQKFLTYQKYTDRRHRAFYPSIMPTGVDPERVREERENIIYNRITNRKAELERLNANLASWDSSKGDMARPNTSMKLKALLEYKMLCLLPKQRALRQQISREMVHADNLAMTANRSLYRRQKKQSLREARLTERLEKQQREARVSKEKQKHDDFINSIVQQADELRKSARDTHDRVRRLGRAMIAQHQQIEKDEQKRVERTAKQRLQALKANDEETYLKLLGQAKDSRISHLLKQTDGFLKQLAASVKDQQRSSGSKWEQNQAPSDTEDEEEAVDEDEESGGKVDYYEVAHRIQEKISVQSGNLVGGSLKDYQLKGLQWMISLYNNKLNGILADEMGLGKTIQTIALITYLIEKKQQRGPFLVIVPLSTLTNWNNEFDKWAPSVRRIVYKGPPNQRKQASTQMRDGMFQVVLTTYEFIIKDRPVLSKIRWLHMIVDEGHRMKNAGSKLSQTITQYYHTRFRIILTGTPLQNNLPELWALLNFVLPNIFKSVKSFDEWFNTPFANTGAQDSMSLTEEEQILVIRRLHKVLRPFLLRRLKKDVEADLPDKQEKVIKCSFSALQAKLYKQLMTSNKLTVADKSGNKIPMRGLSNMLMQLRKLCNHPFVFEEIEDQMNPSRVTNDMLWRVAGKFELLDRILPKFAATGHRVLMFFQMTQIMNIMEDFMRYRGYKYLRLDGSTKSEERADLLEDFNAEGSEYFCFLLSTRAGGLGLNLQTADTVVIFDSDWNPHQDLQAQDRAHRIGQKNEVRIFRLISAKSVEEKILERANFKLDMDGKVIQAGKFDNKSTNEERDAMLRVMLESAEQAEEMQSEEMDDDDLNSFLQRSENELSLFEQMDRDRAAAGGFGSGKKHGRLLDESELPDIFLQDDDTGNDAQMAEEISYGRGARERTRVRYDDGLTEEQWLDAMDADDDTVEAAMSRKQARIDKRKGNKERRDNPDVDTPSVARSSESPAPMVSRRGRGGRKSTGVGRKRTAEVAELDLDTTSAPTPPSQPKKRGRGTKILDTLAPNERDALQASLERVFETIENLTDPLGADPEDQSARDVAGVFVNLPPRANWPDYYQIIMEPIALEQIEKKMKRREYQGMNGFASDVKLMVRNAKTYNDDGSQIYNDAGVMEVCNCIHAKHKTRC